MFCAARLAFHWERIPLRCRAARGSSSGHSDVRPRDGQPVPLPGRVTGVNGLGWLRKASWKDATLELRQRIARLILRPRVTTWTLPDVKA